MSTAELTAKDGRGATPRASQLAGLVAQLRQRGREAGLAALGIAPAGPMEITRRVIEERKAAGLSADMQFTYRNPARSTSPALALPGAAALVVGAWYYGPAQAGEQRPATIAASPAKRPLGRVARYAWRDHYASLRAALGEVAGTLRAAGWRARVLVDDNALVDRAAAELAGVGWFANNGNIVLPGQGSWFVLGSVVTDAPLAFGTRRQEACGPCRHCLQACPTGALVSPGVLDARRCLAWLLQRPGVFPWEHREALQDRIYGCDECQVVCPMNRLGVRARQASGLPSPKELDKRRGPRWPGRQGAQEHLVGQGPEQRDVDILKMLAANDAELLSAYGRWYIAHRDPRYLRRNALIVLGNIADGSSPEVEGALRAYLSHPDELLRAHAIWAAARLAREDLIELAQPALASDPSALVRYELERRSQVRPALPLAGHLSAG
ncbi:MAG: epoxyqueuosine reductase [Acidimicrobiales bacterium]